MYRTFQTMAALLAILICSCQKEESPLTGQVENHPTQPVLGGNMVLGRKLENPYSVENMRKAFALLSPQAKSGIGQNAEEVIQTTHLYVKFSPQTEDEVDLLKLDTTLELYAYPLDYEILNDPLQDNIYVNFTYQDGKPCDYYAAVRVNKTLPSGVKYEILEELFIPDEYSDENPPILTRSGQSMDENFIETLVEESLKLTGNWKNDNVETKGRSKWRPAGNITYYDEVKKKKLGVEGLKVRAKRWFTTHTGFTDANGHFECDGRFKRQADYSFSFEREHFHVRDMEISHNNLKGDWNYHMVRENKTSGTIPTVSPFTYATIFRAAYHYCYKNIHGLQRPPTQEKLRAKIKIDPVNKTDNANGVFSSGFFMGISAKHIEIYNHHNRIDEIYATTIHELAHSAHWVRNRDFYVKRIQDIVKESWARGVQNYLTTDVYPEYSGGTYNRCQYTGIVEDLMDAANKTRKSKYYYENGNNWNEKEKSYTDRVSGYTITQIENALNGAATWEEWKNNIKKINNNTKQYVDEAFNYWNTK